MINSREVTLEELRKHTDNLDRDTKYQVFRFLIEDGKTRELVTDVFEEDRLKYEELEKKGIKAVLYDNDKYDVAYIVPDYRRITKNFVILDSSILCMSPTMSDVDFMQLCGMAGGSDMIKLLAEPDFEPTNRCTRYIVTFMSRLMGELSVESNTDAVSDNEDLLITPYYIFGNYFNNKEVSITFRRKGLFEIKFSRTLNNELKLDINGTNQLKARLTDDNAIDRTIYGVGPGKLGVAVLV